MPQPDDVRVWTTWGAPIAHKDIAKWETTGVDEHKQDGWFFPKQITDYHGTTWESSISQGSATLSYTPCNKSIHDYHVTFTKDNPSSMLVLHETIQGQHKSEVTYEVQKKLDSQLQIKNGSPTVTQQNLVTNIFKYQQDRYNRLFGQKYEKDYSAITEKDGIFKNKFGGLMNPRRDTELQQLLNDSVQQYVSLQISDTSPDNDEHPTKKQRTGKERESTKQPSVDPKLISQFAAIEPKFKLLGKDAKKDTYEYILVSTPMNAYQVKELTETLEKEGFIGMLAQKHQEDGSIILEAYTDKTAPKAKKHGMSLK